MKELKRVVITGLGALTPIGNTLEAFWQGLEEGKSGAGPITNFDASNFKTQFACEVKGFDPMETFGRKEARKMDRFAQMAMVSVDECITDSGIDLESINKDRIGVIWASGIGGLGSLENEVMSFEAGGRNPRFNPFFIPKMIADIASGHISIKYGFRGPNFATVSACASSTNAIADAFNYIRLGKANMILTGGSEASITYAGVGGFNAMKALSQNNENPTGASRPFDTNRDGFVLGEGAGALFLEELEHAKARGAKIYAEVVGSGLSADAYHITATHPEGMGARLAMAAALEDADLEKEDIDYLNVHATSTPVGDISEAKAVEEFFGDHVDKLHISATKSMTGHLLGAAGAIESMAAIFAINKGIIPPTINLDDPDERISKRLNLTPNKSVKAEVNIAMSNTFGFGGHNAIAVFKKYTE
ncbi:MAG: beta-ketoacyl-ACP synthase II [Bacteroidota bacterium]